MGLHVLVLVFYVIICRYVLVCLDTVILLLTDMWQNIIDDNLAHTKESIRVCTIKCEYTCTHIWLLCNSVLWLCAVIPVLHCDPHYLSNQSASCTVAKNSCVQF